MYVCMYEMTLIDVIFRALFWEKRESSWRDNLGQNLSVHFDQKYTNIVFFIKFNYNQMFKVKAIY